jgi:hypothetical protein
MINIFLSKDSGRGKSNVLSLRMKTFWFEKYNRKVVSSSKKGGILSLINKYFQK